MALAALAGAVVVSGVLAALVVETVWGVKVLAVQADPVAQVPPKVLQVPPKVLAVQAVQAVQAVL